MKIMIKCIQHDVHTTQIAELKMKDKVEYKPKYISRWGIKFIPQS